MVRNLTPHLVVVEHESVSPMRFSLFHLHYLSYSAWFIFYLNLFHSVVFFPNQIKVCYGGGRCGCFLKLSSTSFWWQFGQLDFSILVLCWSETQVMLFIWLKMRANTIHHQWTTDVNLSWCKELCCSRDSIVLLLLVCSVQKPTIYVVVSVCRCVYLQVFATSLKVTIIKRSQILHL